MCMKNHAYVPEPLVLAVANQRHGTHRALLELSKRRLLCYESAGRGGNVHFCIICLMLLFTRYFNSAFSPICLFCSTEL